MFFFLRKGEHIFRQLRNQYAIFNIFNFYIHNNNSGSKFDLLLDYQVRFESWPTFLLHQTLISAAAVTCVYKQLRWGGGATPPVLWQPLLPGGRKFCKKVIRGLIKKISFTIFGQKSLKRGWKNWITCLVFLEVVLTKSQLLRMFLFKILKIFPSQTK